ncbi:DUF3597 domain-containing protein [Methylocella silvestris]|uniref:DUF3597 domain-containing protein n=1 Tax=Methylocella silvestris TaxID=199596 RepID=A0A2J7TIU3_METSI|nr:DUF3597 domain-containing protein [Methylocella silvestris]PNG26689.1 hypothetical protein CR492_06765 [Methylocella silvestris]
MSIFGNIISKLFGHSKAEAAPATPPAGGAPAAPTPGATTTAAAPAAGGAAPAPTALKDVDVASILDGLVAKQGQKLDWRHSIVDLLKTLDLDSSLTARKELASELHYSGSTDDTATMNVWLIKQVLAKLAENGGKLPADLVH